VVHRDLKPSNVLIAEDGPRVIDFGISRAAESTALTQAGLVIGSPGFMSPEQAAGFEVGPPSDIFSLGAVLAFGDTGEGPFGTGTTAALLYRVVHGTPGLVAAFCLSYRCTTVLSWPSAGSAPSQSRPSSMPRSPLPLRPPG
jgi:eukaryotic-like serine/threonine-protein kinase